MDNHYFCLRLSLLRIDSLFVKTKNTMINEQDQLMAKIHFFKARYVSTLLLS